MFRYLLVASAVLACAFGAATYNQEAGAYITKIVSDIQPEGNYNYQYETSNGIAAQESGIGGNHATGGFSWYSPEGELVQISYVADENGYQPQGALLPTPPPIPAAILKSLEYIRTHPQYVEQEYRRPALKRLIG
ncbi:larval cuticle protein 4-like [Drosophila simulans]|uniref:GD14264 n=1 Tax=Drosophila simulans TaxID=7240 RepID=B4QPA1_DROSI|nr:larval cuticle protein 4-like [Drosophila simulans]EDX09999.1 GD14264 [Drosophila simulans]